MNRAAVIGVDPGRSKCGVAAVSAEGTLAREVCPTERLVSKVRELAGRTGAGLVVVGGGTNSAALVRALRSQPDLPEVLVVDEKNSTLEARKRYFQENPPKGCRRLIPRTLQSPPEPVDGYVAVILAERALRPGQV